MIEHRDDLASKMGMWLFIFTELLLFGMLFVVYAVYRSMHPEAFKLASEELDAIVKQQQGVNQSNLSAIYESNQQSELSSVAR